MVFEGFNIGRFLLLPGRKLYGFVVEAEPKPGVLSEIAGIPSRYNAVILYVSYSMLVPGEKTITALSFVDLTSADVSAEELMEEVRRLSSVKAVKMVKPVAEGFVVDNFFSRLRLHENRAIILREQGYRGLISGIRERFGSGGEAFLYYVGFEIGVGYGRSHRELGLKLGITDPVRVYRDISVNLFNSVGFGRMEVVEIRRYPPGATLRVYDSFECELGLGAGKPYSHLIRGMIAGVLTVLFDRKVKARETRCIARGDQYCEFEVSP